MAELCSVDDVAECLRAPAARIGQHLRYDPADVQQDQVVVVAELSEDARVMSRIFRDAAAYKPDHLILVTGHACDREGRRCRGLARVIDDLKAGDFSRVTIQAPPHDQCSSMDVCPARMAASRFGCVEGPYEPLPGWLIVRADEPDSSYAGATAIRLARQLRVNVIVSGMPNAVMIGETSGADGQRQTLWGLEIGSASVKARSGGARGKRVGFGVLVGDGTMAPRVVQPDAAGYPNQRPRRYAA